MSKRFLIFLSIIVFILAIAGAIIIWRSVQDRTVVPSAPATTPLSGFPVSAPTTNPVPPTTTEPVATGTATEPNSTTTSPTNPITPPLTSGPLTKLSATPVSGIMLTPRFGSTTPVALVYLEENTGHLFRITPDGQNNQQLTSSSLPGVARVWWGIYKNTITLLAQYLDNREQPVTFRGNYNLKLINLTNTGTTTTIPTELTGADIPNIQVGGIAFSPSRDRFFSLLNTDVGVIGTVTELATGKIRNIFSSPFKSWAVSWPAPTIITLTPRAAAGVPSPLYFLNPDSGALTRILDSQTGLTVLVNPTGTKILYNQELGRLKLYSTEDGSTQTLTMVTLPEKCVWAADAITIYCAVPDTLPTTEIGQSAIKYPDDWWSGEVTFNDSLWKINTATGEGKIVYTNRGASGDNRLDAINLLLDEVSQRLIFTDRWNGLPWSLDLR